MTPPSDRRHERAGNRRFLLGIRLGRAVLAHARRPVRVRAELRRHDVLAGHAIDREEVAVARRRRHQLARLAVDHAVDQDRRLRRIPVVRVVRRGLEVPRHLAGVDVDGDERAREQVVALAAGARVARRRIAGAEDVEPGLRIVRTRNPHLSAAVPRRIEARPRVEPGIARIHRHRVEDPLALAGLRIVRLQEAGRVEVVAGADQHVVVDDDRRHRREVLLIEVGDLDVPAFLAGARVERHEVVVGRLEEQGVVPHRRAATADVRAALRLPEVLPELAAVARVHRPDVVGRGDVEDAVHLEDRALDGGVRRRREIARALRRR